MGLKKFFKEIVDDVVDDVKDSFQLFGRRDTLNKQNLKFPKRDDRDYAATIRFRQIELEGVDTALAEGFSKIFTEATLSRTDGKTGYDDSEETPEDKQKRINDAKAAVDKLQGSNSNLKSYENSAARRKYGRSATLYLPPGISIPEAVTYDNFDLGIIGGVAEAAMQGGASAGSALVDATLGGIESFMSAVSGRTPEGLAKQYGGFAAMRAAQQLPDTGFSEFKGAVRGVTRTAVNPNSRALFKSVPIREFSFTFRLVAQSPDEAEEIYEIVRFFREQMYPEEIKGIGSLSNISLGYKFPDPFEIKVFYGNEQIKELAFLDCYLKQVSANYNQNGPAFHRDGRFTEVDLSLSFIEARALSRDLLKQLYDE